MKFTSYATAAATGTVVLYCQLTGTSGFAPVLYQSNPRSAKTRKSSQLDVARYGPQDVKLMGNGRNKKNGHPEFCPCCINDNLFSPLSSPRNARIVSPLATLLGANVVLPESAFAGGEKPFECAVQKYFPKAMVSSQIQDIVTQELKSRDYGYKNTLFGTSICPDEINTKPNGRSLAIDFQKALSKQNGVFTLGGLAGLPFAGVSGMGAFLSHCPVQGKVVIFFGPHVGVSKEGTLGKVERLGQTKLSTSCGAAIGALKAINASKENPNNGDRDFQEDYIISNLRPRLEAGGSKVTNDAMPAFVTRQVFYLIQDMLMDELNTIWSGDKFWDKISEVALVGGILINRGQASKSKAELEDYFQPLVFETWSKACGCNVPAESTDIYEKVFG